MPDLIAQFLELRLGNKTLAEKEEEYFTKVVPANSISLGRNEDSDSQYMGYSVFDNIDEVTLESVRYNYKAD